MLPALLHRVGWKVIFADGDDARDDRYDLCDVLAEGRWGSWTADSVDDVLDRHHDGVGLRIKIGLETRNRSAIRETADRSEMHHLQFVPGVLRSFLNHRVIAQSPVRLPIEEGRGRTTV